MAVFTEHSSGQALHHDGDNLQVSPDIFELELHCPGSARGI